MRPGSRRRRFRSYRAITFSRSGSDGPGRRATKGRWRRWSGMARRNFLVPVPRCASWEELNARFTRTAAGGARQQRLRGHGQTIGERFEKDHAALLPLPATSYEALRTKREDGRVRSLSLALYRSNDYSVSTCWELPRGDLVGGYGHEVAISCGVGSNCTTFEELRAGKT